MSNTDHLDQAQANLRAAMANICSALAQEAMAGRRADAYRVNSILADLQDWSAELTTPVGDPDEAD